jgi:4-amino-4-deoxy-L-arabinose transferase-like glycosyltransferase
MTLREGGSALPASSTARAAAPVSLRSALRALLRRRWAALALVAIVALGAGLRASQAADPGRYLSSDERSYARVALSLAGGTGYEAPGMTDPWHWAPGAPALFALAHLIAPGADGDRTPAQLRTAFWAQAAVGTALILVLYLLAAGIAGRAAGLAAALAVATYPPLVGATGDLVSELLGALTLALAMLALLHAWRRPGAGRLALAGLALGAAMLVRADLLVLPLVLGAAWLLLARRARGTRTAAGEAAVVALLPLLVVAPWIAYASSQAGRLIPIASSGPSTLFVGTYLPGDGKLSGVRRELEPYVRRHMSNLSEVPIANVKGEFVLRAYIRERHPELIPGPYRAIPERDLRRALSFEARRNLKYYAREQPLAFAAMELRKVTRMWGGAYRGGTRNPRTWITTWHLVLVTLAFSGALAGLLLARRRRAELALLLVPVLLSTAVNAAFVAQARHNLRVLPLLIVAGTAGAALAWQALVRSRHTLPPEADPPGSQIRASRRVPALHLLRR